MKITLLNYTTQPIKTIYTAARTCYSSDNPTDIWEREVEEEEMYSLLDKTIESGHHSIFEHISLTFAIRGISRTCSHQLVRHRIASYSQQSQRYVKYNEASYVKPERIRKRDNIDERYIDQIDKLFSIYNEFVDEGVPEEDARFILPNATKTNIVMTMNFRELYTVCSIRLCSRAQWEIRELFWEIKSSIQAEDELTGLADYLQPKCEHIGYCPEASSCGRMPDKEDVIKE